MSRALAVNGRIDRIERLHSDPPAEWERTSWAICERRGDTVLVETAIVSCPECGGEAFWAHGRVACGECETRQRLIG